MGIMVVDMSETFNTIDSFLMKDTLYILQVDDMIGFYDQMYGSGSYDRLNKEEKEILIDRDKRNLFLGIAPEGTDMKDLPLEQYEKMHCVSFGDCHLSKYDVEFSLNSPILVNTSYACANIQYHSSGSGFIPAMTTSDFTPVNDNIFIVPNLKGEISGHVSGVAEPLRIGDMNLRITAPLYGTEKEDILDAGINYRDLSVQNASISIEINRQAWKGLGHKLPIDRPVKYPIIVRTTIRGIVGETRTEGPARNPAGRAIAAARAGITRAREPVRLSEHRHCKYLSSMRLFSS